MPVDFPLKPQHPKNVSRYCQESSQGPHPPPPTHTLENGWFASQQDCHCNSWVLLPPGKGCGPCCCHSGCLLQMACQRGEHICPRGPQGPVSAMFSPTFPPLLFLPCLHTGPESFHPSPPLWLLACLSAAVSTAGQLRAKGKYLQLRGSRRTAQAHKRLG